MRLLVPSVVFACYDASCRPPTSGGTGGSTKRGSVSHGSIVPRDTHPRVGPSDAHPKAPGSDNPAAVRGHKGVKGNEPERRIPRQGETIDAYRDLGRGREHKRGFPDGATMSLRHASNAPGDRVGLVVASSPGVVLTDPRPAWAASAKAQAEASGKRGVHAFIRGEVKEYVDPAELAKRVEGPEWQKVTYYPGTQDFFNPTSRHRFVGGSEVALVNGEMFVRHARFDWSGPRAPISKIEEKMAETNPDRSVDVPMNTTTGYRKVPVKLKTLTGTPEWHVEQRRTAAQREAQYAAERKRLEAKQRDRDRAWRAK